MHTMEYHNYSSPHLSECSYIIISIYMHAHTLYMYSMYIMYMYMYLLRSYANTATYHWMKQCLYTIALDINSRRSSWKFPLQAEDFSETHVIRRQQTEGGTTESGGVSVWRLLIGRCEYILGYCVTSLWTWGQREVPYFHPI